MIVHPHAQPRPPVKSVISRAKRHVTLPHPKVEYGGLGRKKGCFTSIRTVLNRRLAPKWGRPKFGEAPYKLQISGAPPGAPFRFSRGENILYKSPQLKINNTEGTLHVDAERGGG